MRTYDCAYTWVKSSRKQPGASEILHPGEPEYRISQQRHPAGIPVEDSVGDEMIGTTESLGLAIQD